MEYIKPLSITKLLVFGGNGFVGQAVVKAALDAGIPEVVGLSRRGAPDDFMHDLDKHPSYAKNLKGQKADIIS